MCAEHEATTKTQPRNGIPIRCHDDDLRFETIIASKSTTPAIQSRPTSVPSEARHALTSACTDTATSTRRRTRLHFAHHTFTSKRPPIIRPVV
jgi:hypothetical protein